MNLFPTVSHEAKEAREAMEAYKDNVKRVFDGPLSMFRDKHIASQYFKDIETVMTQFLNPVPKEFRKMEQHNGRRGRVRTKPTRTINVYKFMRTSEAGVMEYTKGSRRQNIMADFHNLLFSFARNSPEPIVHVPFDDVQEFIRFEDVQVKTNGHIVTPMGLSSYEVERDRKQERMPYIADRFHETITQVDVAFSPHVHVKEYGTRDGKPELILAPAPENVVDRMVSIGILLRNKDKALSSVVLTGKKKGSKGEEHDEDPEFSFSMYVPPTQHAFWNTFYNSDWQKKSDIKACVTPVYCTDLSFLMKNANFCKALNERIQFLVTATKSMRYLAEKHSGNVFFSKGW